MHEERLAAKAGGAGIVAAFNGEIRSFGTVTPDERIEVGSVTKVPTGRLLVLLAEVGAVRPDEPSGGARAST